jgi:replication-associated recombination protein RarA
MAAEEAANDTISTAPDVGERHAVIAALEAVIALKTSDKSPGIAQACASLHASYVALWERRSVPLWLPERLMA